MPKSSQRSCAVVTGAAHRIGYAIALELARQGYAIGLHYHQSSEQAVEAQSALEALGVPVLPLPADLTQPDQIDGLFERVSAWGYPLRVLVNSAAVMQPGDVRTLPVNDWDLSLALNLRAPWLCARAAAQRMEPDGGGVIINISDSGAQKAWTGYPAYIISKAGVETLTRLLAKALAPHIRVNAVAPGLILPSPDLPPERWQRLVDRLPLQESGSPEDVARAVTFFIQNPYITGQVLAVDGGYQMV